MSTMIMRLTGALALLGSGALALPHPDLPPATLTQTVTAAPMTTTDWTTMIVTASPSFSTSTLDCDQRVCVNGTSWCRYWAGITGWDSYHQPIPGETVTNLGTCGGPVTPATTTSDSTSTTTSDSTSTTTSDSISTTTTSDSISTTITDSTSTTTSDSTVPSVSDSSVPFSGQGPETGIIVIRDSTSSPAAYSNGPYEFTTTTSSTSGPAPYSEGPFDTATATSTSGPAPYSEGPFETSTTDGINTGSPAPYSDEPFETSTADATSTSRPVPYSDEPVVTATVTSTSDPAAYSGLN
ncbi:hypothetical protein F4821DRAFT_138078 [Hypoxylon rubiginosum]|uniref:Uncharacterized protein n=1 Tax=Hypoxylon rubiginosum TaxID=110542 RepID=A0ACC0DJA5_9PEZI|nr:hypothetical protein F4821DRAFT_138078 [Hypoxylon rubiginosum]